MTVRLLCGALRSHSGACRRLEQTDTCQGFSVRPITAFRMNGANAEPCWMPRPRVHDQEFNGATPGIAERKSVEPVEA